MANLVLVYGLRLLPAEEVKRVGADRALIKQNGEAIEVNLPLDERILVKITGSHGATEEDALKLIRDLDRKVLKDAK